MKYIIIGGVAGGATAAARIRRNTEKAEIILFEKGEYISYANCGLPYYIGGVIEDRERLFVQTPESFGKRFNIDIRTRSEVTAIDVKKKEVTVRSSGKTYTESYDKLLLSPGASPVRPPLPGIDTEGIFTLRNDEYCGQLLPRPAKVRRNRLHQADKSTAFSSEKRYKFLEIRFQVVRKLFYLYSIKSIDNMRTFIFFLCTLTALTLRAQQHTLESQIRQVTESIRAQVGVAVIIDGKDTVTVNNDSRYPLMSVVKYPQSLAVAHFLHQHNRPLSTEVFIAKEALHPDTYSPLRDEYPEGNLYLPISRLLEYTLQQSDNNACDILFEYIGGVSYTERYIRSLGAECLAISRTEEQMHQSPESCYDNWSSPLEMARLTDMLFSKELFPSDYQNFIKETMLNCVTGENRLPQPLMNTTARIGHKTGTSGLNARGELAGINDAGFVILPDGRRYSIAVLIKDSKENMKTTEKVIADISEIVYRYLTLP